MKGIHVVHKNNAWSIEGSRANQNSFKTQATAIKAATKIAKKAHTELLVHGRNGKIRARNSYGHDPYPPKG